MLRHESWPRPAGESPARVSAEAPGSRPQSRGEISVAERGVESLYGGSKRAGCDCNLVTSTTEEPSRSCHGEGHVRRANFGFGRRVLPGYGKLHARKVWSGTWETRLPSLVSEDRPYKPKVKWDGGQRESEGAVVVTIGVQKNAPGAKGPRFDHARNGDKCKVMAGPTIRSNHPVGHKPGEAVASQMAPGAPREGCARETRRGLWTVAKQPPQRASRGRWSRRADSPRAPRLHSLLRGCVAAPGRSSVSRVRENRTHGLKGESGNRPA